MSRSHRCGKVSGRAGQYHGSVARRCVAVLLTILCFAANPGYSQTLLRIQVLEGEGVVNGAGTRSQRPIAVQLTDETGRPLEGIAVSFKLPEEGPSGAFESGMKTEVVITSADGRAAVHGIRWNRLPGPFQIRVTAAKGESRAGTICSQYISETPVSKSGPLSKAGGGGKGKWITILAVAAGSAAGAGLILGRGNGKASPSGPPATPTQPVQIGIPTITIGRP